LVPFVLIPRHAIFSGEWEFTTVPRDVADYSRAYVAAWQPVLRPGAPWFAIVFEESADQETWTTCADDPGGELGDQSEVRYAPTLTKRWFRAKVRRGATGPGVSCWASGFLEPRQH
jgi:hypothetical protein